MWGLFPTKIIDPYAGIDQNHLSVLIASRSPCQSSFPRNRRISSCLRRRTTVRRPSSTASRLVFKPVSRRVSFINLSSMTILVRMMCTQMDICTHSSSRAGNRANSDCLLSAMRLCPYPQGYVPGYPDSTHREKFQINNGLCRFLDFWNPLCAPDLLPRTSIDVPSTGKKHCNSRPISSNNVQIRILTA